MKTYCLIIKKYTNRSLSDFSVHPYYFDTMEQAIEYLDNIVFLHDTNYFTDHTQIRCSLYEIDMEVPASDAAKLLEEVIL